MTSHPASTRGPVTAARVTRARSRSSFAAHGSKGFGGITPSLAIRSTGGIKVLAVMLSALKKSVDLKNYDKCASKYRAGTLLVQYPALAITRKRREMIKRPLPDLEYLRQCVSYSPDTGRFVFLERPRWMFKSDHVWKQWNGKNAGKEAFVCQVRTRGYIKGKLDGQTYYAHRLAYYMGTGELPIEVDHINGDVADNRLANLRSVTRKINNRNRAHSVRHKNPAMGVGVTETGRFRASIKFDGIVRLLGTYDTLAEAVAARRGAERLLGFHKNHGRDQIRASII